MFQILALLSAYKKRPSGPVLTDALRMAGKLGPKLNFADRSILAAAFRDATGWELTLVRIGAAVVNAPVALRFKDRDQWLAARAGRIGASEVASLFGCGYQTVRELWEIKAGHQPPENLDDILPVALGSALESGFAVVLRRFKEWRLRKARRYLIHPDETLNLACTLDYERWVDAIGWVPVELKVFDFSSFSDQFLETEISGEYEPGLRQSLQLQTQLLITGKPVGYIAVLVSNRQIVVCQQDAHPGVQDMIVRRAREFWRSIDSNDAPAFDLDKDLELMARTLTNIDTGLELDWRGDDEANQLLNNYGKWSATEKEASDAKDRIRAQMYLRLGTAVRAKCEAGQVSAKLSADGARKSLRLTPRNK